MRVPSEHINLQRVRQFISLQQRATTSKYRVLIKEIHSTKASWRNGSAFDSRSKGYPFKSGWGHSISLFAILPSDSTVNSSSGSVSLCVCIDKFPCNDIMALAIVFFSKACMYSFTLGQA
ncbi:hypothetical protein QR685DRAFT_582840 [Neurospora intermedia]|uniref:Uncharacterized protein n=1 Tax=Neurospora intermedia TaxID=5142 RepID=A0ABR3DJ21_NEUIN